MATHTFPDLTLGTSALSAAPLLRERAGMELLLCSITLLAAQTIDDKRRDWSLTLLGAVLATLQDDLDPVTACAVNGAGAGASLLTLLQDRWVGAPPGGLELLRRILPVASRLPAMEALQGAVLHFRAMVAAGASQPQWAVFRGTNPKGSGLCLRRDSAARDPGNAAHSDPVSVPNL